MIRTALLPALLLASSAVSAQGMQVIDPTAPPPAEAPPMADPGPALPTPSLRPMPALPAGVEDHVLRDAPLLERPLRAARRLLALKTGSTVQVQHAVQNADGLWCYVDAEGASGWLKAEVLHQCTP